MPAPTERQLRYLGALAAERGVDLVDFPIQTTRDASETITRLMALPRLPNVERTPKEVAAEGVYVVDNGPEQVVYVVRPNRRTGRRSAYRMNPNVNTRSGRARFDYARGVVFQLTADQLITREQAIALGAEFAICVRCGRRLGDPQSVEASIGPVCWRHMFGESRSRAGFVATALNAPQRPRRVAHQRTCRVCGEDFTSLRTTCDECLELSPTAAVPAPPESGGVAAFVYASTPTDPAWRATHVEDRQAVCDLYGPRDFSPFRSLT